MFTPVHVMENYSTSKNKILSFSKTWRELDLYQSNHLSTDEINIYHLLAYRIRI